MLSNLSNDFGNFSGVIATWQSRKKAWMSVKIPNKSKNLDCHALMPGLPRPTKAKSVGLAMTVGFAMTPSITLVGNDMLFTG
jgi:hypothetical protein